MLFSFSKPFFFCLKLSIKNETFSQKRKIQDKHVPFKPKKVSLILLNAEYLVIKAIRKDNDSNISKFSFMPFYIILL